MSLTTPQGPPAPPGGAPPGEPGRGPGGRTPGLGARRWLAITGAALVVALVAGVLTAVLGGRGTEQVRPPPAPPATTTPPTTPPTPSTAPPTADLARAVYPTPASTVRFSEPVAAARSFAEGYVGFVDPVVGTFLATGAATGTVEVRPTPSGPVTEVDLERLAGTWWVLGAQTGHIVVDQPTASAEVASPVRLAGTSTAFEATVGVEVRQDDLEAPIGTGYVMGGSMGEMGPFDATLSFAAPTTQAGAILFTTVSMENGAIWEATVVRVRFAPVATLTPTAACPDYAMAPPSPPPGEMVTTVYYSCSIDAAPVPTYRLGPKSTAVLQRALQQLLAGPTPAEGAAGLTSWFSGATAGMLQAVTLSSGAATVDFSDMRTVIPNASSSAGARLLLAQLDATVFQFTSVQSVTYRFEGSCQAFAEWLQLAGCVTQVSPAP